MAESHTVEDIKNFQSGRGGARIIFKSGKNWLIIVKDAFTDHAAIEAKEEEWS